MELRFESSLTKAVDSLSRDAWDLGIVTIRGGQSADALHEAIRGGDPRLPLLVVDPHPSVEAARSCLQAGPCDYLALDQVEVGLEDALVRLLATSRKRDAEEVLRRVVERP